jgi:predicted RNA binding protein YcfA (HicA-like mRNA interferase family)
MKGKELVRRLESEGWVVKHLRGSHVVLTKEGRHLTVPVHAGKELGKGLLHRLLKEAGLS